MNLPHALETLESRRLLSAAHGAVPADAWPGGGAVEMRMNGVAPEARGATAEIPAGMATVRPGVAARKPAGKGGKGHKVSGKPASRPSHFAVRMGTGVRAGPYATVFRPAVNSPVPQSPQGATLHLVNGSFESFPNFAGWETAGNASVRGAEFLAPADGSVQGVLSTGLAAAGAGPAADASELEEFLGLTAGSLSGSPGSPAVNGTALRQTFSGQAGDTLTLTYNFLTNESAAGSDDFAFVVLGGNGQTQVDRLAGARDAGLTAAPPAEQAANGLDRATGPRTYTLTLPSAGTFTVGLGVVNVGDPLGNSTLAVDKF